MQTDIRNLSLFMSDWNLWDCVMTCRHPCEPLYVSLSHAWKRRKHFAEFIDSFGSVFKINKITILEPLFCATELSVKFEGQKIYNPKSLYSKLLRFSEIQRDKEIRNILFIHCGKISAAWRHRIACNGSKTCVWKLCHYRSLVNSTRKSLL